MCITFLKVIIILINDRLIEKICMIDIYIDIDMELDQNCMESDRNPFDSNVHTPNMKRESQVMQEFGETRS